jgi:DNA-binding NtrC family response regulator
VRELSNAVQRLIVTPDRVLGDPVAAGTSGNAGALACPAPILLPLRVARREASEAFERAYLQRVLERSQGNVTRAAAIAEVSRQMLQKLMRKHDAE